MPPWKIFPLFFPLFSGIYASSELGVVISQQGVDQLSKYSVKKALKVVHNNPFTLKIESKEEPGLRPLGNVVLSNAFLLKNARLMLEKDTLGIVLQDIQFQSEMNLSAELWPIPIDTETVHLNFSMGQTYLGIGAKNGTKNDLYLKTCTVTKPKLDMASKNYWLLDSSLRLGSKWLKNNFEWIFCPQISSLIGYLRSMLFATIPISNFIIKDVLAEEIKDLSMKYELVEIDIDEGHLAAGVAITWVYPNSTEKEIAANFSEPALNIESSDVMDFEKGGPHVTLWIQEGVINELLELFHWDFVWMTDQVPVNSTKIPESSRKFLSVLCHNCYFKLEVRNYGPPKLVATNGSLALHHWDKIKLWVVNPSRKLTSIFVSFFSFFDGQIDPFVENGRLKAKIELKDVKVNMSKSAFPPEWGHFIKDLVQGMIQGMIWPQLQGGIEHYSEKVGIVLPATCGIDPKSARIEITPGKFGIGTNLKLFDMDFEECGRSITGNLPNVDF